ncbi:hypothetical protein ACWCSH_13145, partial [Streptosporangium sp. NPDC001682]
VVYAVHSLGLGATLGLVRVDAEFAAAGLRFTSSGDRGEDDQGGQDDGGEGAEEGSGQGDAPGRGQQGDSPDQIAPDAGAVALGASARGRA